MEKLRFTYLQEAKEDIYHKLDELQDYVEKAQQNPSEDNFSWIYCTMRELTVQIKLL